MSTGKKGKSSLPPHNGSEVKYVPKKKESYFVSKLFGENVSIINMLISLVYKYFKEYFINNFMF